MGVSRKQYPPPASISCYGNGNGNGNGRVGVSSTKVCCLCFVSFCLGVLFFNRFEVIQDPEVIDESSQGKNQDYKELQKIAACEKKKHVTEAGNVLPQPYQTHNSIMSLDRTIYSLEMQLAAARAVKAENKRSKLGSEHSNNRPNLFFVMGIMTTFSNRKRRDSIRNTWMPQGEKLKRLEREKGIVMRFVIGHSFTPGSFLDRAIDAEEEKHMDFLRLNYVERKHDRSSKTQLYFSIAVANWDAEYYIKVDDDIHVNLGVVGSILAQHRSKPRVYIGCMKSRPVVSQKGVKFHEPEFWKFGEAKYFRHATGQIYAISKDLATYITMNRYILHTYANEDVSLGSWLIGLDVEHVDDRSFCCATLTECEGKAVTGNACVASFDWNCSGICKSVERMKEIHLRCGEGDEVIWHSSV